MVRSTLNSGGFGEEWGHTLSYSNQLSNQGEGANGNSWFVKQLPSIASVLSFPTDPNKGTFVVLSSITSPLWFEFKASSNSYVGKFAIKQRLFRVLGPKEFLLLDPDGRQTVFYDFSASHPVPLRGKVKRFTDSNGHRTDVIYDVEHRPIRFKRTSGSNSSDYAYSYYGVGADDGRVQYVTHSINGSAVRRDRFEYHSGTDAHGSAGDLKLVAVQQYVGSTWTELSRTYYRYYKLGDANGFEHGIKYAVEPEAYKRMQAAGLAPETATDAQVAAYADYYFEYDLRKRVTVEKVHAGSQTYSFAYASSAFVNGMNNWKVKTTETLPDGNQNIVFTNHVGQAMLKVFKAGSSKWFTFYKYDANGREIMVAESSAVTGYDETKADLLNYQGGKYLYLSDNSGLIRVYDYYTTTDSSGAAKGYLSAEKLKRGQLGAEIKLREVKYVKRTVGSKSIFPIWKDTVYRSDVSGGSDPVTTEYIYQWFSDSLQMQQRTTKLPVVPTDQNGSGIADQRVEVFDGYGRVIWQKDERGFITRLKYATATDALTERIDDVNTSVEPGAPTGWVTPTGGGLNLVTIYTSDTLGRITQTLGPEHAIDLGGSNTTIRRAKWTVYKDVEHEQWDGEGYLKNTSYTLINPVSLTKMDAANRIVDQIQAKRASTNGKLAPSNTFPQTSWVRWTHANYDNKSLLTFDRLYHLIPTSGDGANGTNYAQTDYGYDQMRRQKRVKTPGGTITGTVYNSRGWVTDIRVGTNDSSSNNMVKLQTNEYDLNLIGGDGNLTQVTLHENASNNRITKYSYDFRNRRIVEDGELDFYATFQFDNLNRVTRSDRRNTNPAGTLIGRSETKFDNRGRVYQSIVYGVDPSTGTVGNPLTDNQWYDPSGNVLKQLAAGSRTFQKMRYDGINRVTKRYTAYDLSESTYAQAGDVSGDTVMQQEEFAYDAASNLIQQVIRERFHDATGTGELTSPNGAQPKARVSYVANWADALGRGIATANYGTNGANAFTRPALIPARSDTVLVSSTAYNDRGEAYRQTNPKAQVAEQTFDNAGQVTKVVENVISGGTGPDQNRTTDFVYNADGKLKQMTVKNSTTGDQVTTWEYGTTLSNSDVASNELLRAKVYPRSSADRVEYKYNRLGQPKEIKDQRGSVRVLEYDKLGRLLHDRVTTLGTGVDGAVRRISRAYEVRGMLRTVTSYDNAAVGSGAVVNEVRLTYNEFGQLVQDFQAHAGVVVTGTTPKTQYLYANGSANTVRRTHQFYPDGRVTAYDYGSANGMNDVLSRVAALKQGTNALAAYTYLGLGEFVREKYD